jgi:NAD(P)-dependent dehydrogenase (short-subunit alcohol dehydrogenase family)
VVSPEKSPVLGLCLTIPQEHPQIRCATIDVERSPANGTASVVELLRAELLTEAAGQTVGYRGAQRWLQTWESATVAGDDEVGTLREEGVYLITGGLGHIGLVIAERLARAVRARLVLVGRSTPPPKEAWQDWIDTHDVGDPVARQIEALRSLEALGAEVLVASADVADLDQMQAVVARATGQFGTIHGVIHAAGILRAGFGPLQSLGRDACELQFRPKVAGLYALDRATADLPLDFCLLTSSLSALLGGLGYGAYAAANQFLDSFVEHRASTGRRWVSVNFDGWAFEREAVTTATGALEMLPAEGVESLMRILGDRSLTRVAVSTADLDTRLDRYVRKTAPVDTAAAAAMPRHARPDMATSFAAPDGEIEETIADVWKGLFGIEQIGRDDNFFDLGGHSLLATQLTSRLRVELGIELRLSNVFAAPTIAGMAALLLQQMLEEQGADVQEELLGEVQQLPPR